VRSGEIRAACWRCSPSETATTEELLQLRKNVYASYPGVSVLRDGSNVGIDLNDPTKSFFYEVKLIISLFQFNNFRMQEKISVM